MSKYEILPLAILVIAGMTASVRIEQSFQEEFRNYDRMIQRDSLHLAELKAEHERLLKLLAARVKPPSQPGKTHGEQIAILHDKPVPNGFNSIFSPQNDSSIIDCRICPRPIAARFARRT